MGYLMGIDLGTSSVKTIVMAENGEIRGSAQGGYDILIPSIGYAEQQPETWWKAAAQTMRSAVADAGISPHEIESIGLSGQMHGMVLIDDKHEVIRPAIVWSDQRSVREAEDAYRIVGKNELGRITLNPAFTGFQTISLLWVKHHEPQNYGRISTVLSPKDYIRLKLTGEVGTDITDASATLAFDTANQQWSSALIEKLGLEPDFYPKTFNPYEIAGQITREASLETGLAAGTPVVFGGGDQPMQAVGNGIVLPGQVSLTIGTGGQAYSVVEHPYHDPQLRTHTFCNAVPGTWNIMGATLSAGLSLSWLNKSLLSELPYNDINTLAGGIRPGSEGLIFLPYLNGERTPHMDAAARGTFLGITLKHDKAHFIRSVMEGVVFALKDCVEILGGLGIPMNTFIASGGGARSAVWMQIQADILNREILKVEQAEQASAGAAIMAGVGIGRYSSIQEACSTIVQYSELSVSPISENVCRYEELYEIYKDAYKQNKALFQRLTEFQ
ncbi:xylulokinase [Paenibacillus senegalensis]|uniref:xylulokinase n=1 Tax=Paenibacillus senegalensis TaxID=1465766 RepID=UPI000289CBCD|nr:xylulokinase [Paenibacillus senegalensis]